MSADRLSIEDLESIVPRLAYHIDHTPPGERELFLMKAFLYLAGLHGDKHAVMKSLDRAADAGHVKGRGKRLENAGELIRPDTVTAALGG